LFTYNHVSSKTSRNGEEIPAGANQLDGANVFAQCTMDGKIQVDSILGKTISDATKNALSASLNALTNNLHFPDNPMKIGDTFTQEVPFNLPIPGVTALFMIKVVYKLSSIDNGIASFDLIENLDMNISDKSNNTGIELNGTGTGNGKMTYDIKEWIATNTSSDMKITYIMKMGPLTFNGESAASTTNTTVVAEAK
jgi:hypothetical protein